MIINLKLSILITDDDEKSFDKSFISSNDDSYIQESLEKSFKKSSINKSIKHHTPLLHK